MYLKNYPENELDVTLLVALIDNPKLHISNSEINELRGYAHKDVQDEMQTKMLQKMKDFEASQEQKDMT